MYNEHFGFQESPFSAAPSSRFFYVNEQYQESLANLRYGIEWKKGLIVMTGEVGTGKTTLLGKTIASLGAATHPVFVSYNHLTYPELLRLISKQLDLNADSQDRVASVEQLREHLIAQHEKGHIVALLIDEAQGLSDEMFEEIRFLSNFENEAEKLIQIVLTGQPELERRLDQPSLRHIKQRVVVHCRLAPLERDEVGRYIATRLGQAGHQGGDLFNPDAVARIARYSRGIPRIINIICDNALLLAFAQSERKITTDMIDEAARDLGIDNESFSRGASSQDAGRIDARTPTSSAGVETRIEAEAGSSDRRNRFTRIAAGVSLAIIAAGGLSATIYSLRPRAGSKPMAITEGPSRVAATLANQINEPIPRVAAPSGIGQEENLRLRPVDVTAVTPAKPAKIDRPDMTAKHNSRVEGQFRVTAPFSFVRSSPRSDARIVATLKPGAALKIVSAKGSYFRIQATVGGRSIRGYVHREDAFFERVKEKNDGPQETALQ